jgi:hypothetical protein
MTSSSVTMKISDLGPYAPLRVGLELTQSPDLPLKYIETLQFLAANSPVESARGWHSRAHTGLGKGG